MKMEEVLAHIEGHLEDVQGKMGAAGDKAETGREKQKTKKVKRKP
jgi:hypothetical protein